MSGLASNIQNNEIFTVWLDTRLGNNNLYGASSNDGGLTWNKNQLIYKGTQGGICDCCKPSVYIDKSGKVNVMFRNKLNGARNMYLITSKDGGKHFEGAQKLGVGDYMINACPMDGGDLAVNANGKISTVWRRQAEIYLAKPGQPEVRIGEGRTPVIAETVKGPVIAWHQNGAIQFQAPDGSKVFSLGQGQYPKLAVMPDSKTMLCTFERDGQVYVKNVAL